MSFGDSNLGDDGAFLPGSPLRVAFRRAASLRFHASGLAHAAAIQAAVPSARVALPARGGFVPKVAVHFVCTAARSARGSAQTVRGRFTGGIVPKLCGHPARQRQRPPIGSLMQRRFTPVYPSDYPSKTPGTFVLSYRQNADLRHAARIAANWWLLYSPQSKLG